MSRTMTMSMSRSRWVAAAAPSLMPFLRPLALPRAASILHVMRLSGSASRHDQERPAVEPTSTSPSPPSSASPSSSPPPPSSSPSSVDTPTNAPQQPYFVNRTHSKNLPVYLLAKRGGNLRQTLIRKIEGDAGQLKAQLEQHLGLEPKRVAVNQLTNHVTIKGWIKPDVLKFLEERHF